MKLTRWSMVGALAMLMLLGALVVSEPIHRDGVAAIAASSPVPAETASPIVAASYEEFAQYGGCPQGDCDCDEDCGCTDIFVGKAASTDGSTITAHTCDGAYDSRLIILPAADHEPGEMAPVYKGIIRASPEFPASRYAPMTKLGEIPEVSHTYKTFKIAYPFANEHQVLIGENTIGNAKVASPNLDEAIMYIEQMEIFCLQRSLTARECVQVMGSLAEEYGYADGGEGLAIADPNEVWLFEVYAVGPLWRKESGTPGAVWCAQRLPDDHISVQPNKSRIGEVNIDDTENFMCSSNYKQAGIDLGLYDPASGPFVWKYVYNDVRGREDPRLWKVFSALNPSGNWQFDDVANYPFSVKPDQKVSIQDVIALYHDTLVGTEYDITEDPVWYYQDRDGKMVKTPYATPQVSSKMATWLGVSPKRKIAITGCSYFFVGQTRDWMPNEIGGVLWFGLNNPATSPWIPVWVGIEEVPESWTVLDRTKVDRNTAWWAFELADNLVNVRYGDLKPILDSVLDPLQLEINTGYELVEKLALELYATDPSQAAQLLTSFTKTYMTKAEQEYWNLVDMLLFQALP